MNKMHHASGDRIRPPLTPAHMVNPPRVAMNGQPNIRCAIIVSTSAMHAHHLLRNFQINGGKL
jgi:hypothetical protein